MALYRVQACEITDGVKETKEVCTTDSEEELEKIMRLLHDAAAMVDKELVVWFEEVDEDDKVITPLIPQDRANTKDQQLLN